MTWTAVVPVAFLSRGNVDMTDAFLARLLDEPGLDVAAVYFNGGRRDGLRLLKAREAADDRLIVFPAEGWPFYRMWNRGLRAALQVSAVALVLNNDIRWPRGGLDALARGLAGRPDDVVAAVPNLLRPVSDGVADERPEPVRRKSRARLTCCWAARRGILRLPAIDERYRSWYGDNELERLVAEAGLRVEMFPGVPVEHDAESTMGLVPGVARMRQLDRRLYLKKWGRP